MSAAKGLQTTVLTRVSDLGYPDDCHVLVHQNEDVTVHEIWYNAAPAALFANAPNGSLLHRSDAGNVALYQKNGALGSIDGAWVSVALA